MVFILPISTQIKEPKPWYHEHVFVNGKLRLVNLTQGRVISTRRFLRKQGTLDNKDFQKVKNAFIKQFL
ncbi:type II toxin-antitoxin system PemK/MazF family toxin [Patescibacteria group bacterium]|nr:type II toxin-antitoxin system PemK/MazF family toxin [Patescibacteria group bacterium]MBU1721386.1 type II toxin-antitoxin system PemK/MazF family toxin [Patescibacteria group bacterium]